MESRLPALANANNSFLSAGARASPSSRCQTLCIPARVENLNDLRGTKLPPNQVISYRLEHLQHPPIAACDRAMRVEVAALEL